METNGRRGWGYRTMKRLAGLALVILTPGAAQAQPSPAAVVRNDMSGLGALGVVSQCDDPEHDNTASLQAAAQQAADTGRPLMITGKCRVNGTIRITDARSGNLTVEAVGLGEIDTNGQDLFNVSPAAGTPKIKLVFDNLIVTNRGPKNKGTFLTVSCLSYRQFCLVPSQVRNTTANDIGTLLTLYGVNGMVVADNTLTRYSIDPSVTAPFVDLQGGTSAASTSCNSGIFINNNQVYGGTFTLLNGCSQGIRWRDNNLLLGYFGVQQTNPWHVEAMQMQHNYFEAWAGGIRLLSSAFDQITGNSFDRGNIEPSTNYNAIALGTGNMALPNEMIEGNIVFGMQGARLGTPFYLNVGNASVVANNAVNGLITPVSGSCMAVGTDNSGDKNPRSVIATVSVTGNVCWASGIISPIGKGFMARGNFYTNRSGVNTLFEQN